MNVSSLKSNLIKSLSDLNIWAGDKPYLNFGSHVNYIVERKNWAVKWDGIQICREINKQKGHICSISNLPLFRFNSVIHFGSQFLWQQWNDAIPRNTKVVVSFFHGRYGDGAELDKHVDYFREHNHKIDRIIVPNSIVYERLIDWGVSKDKLEKIPLGVNTKIFRPPTISQRIKARASFGLDEKTFVIGSFQKDGEGWGNGDSPKMIKGPDIFAKIVGHIAKDKDITVLLTGPARGYIKKQLKRKGIKFKYAYFKNYEDLYRAYWALDCYLMTSREEGGPKSLLESFACNVPVVSSDIGMAPDLFDNELKRFLFDVNFAENGVKIFNQIFKLESSTKTLNQNFQKIASEHDWEIISQHYFKKVYKPLLSELK